MSTDFVCTKDWIIGDVPHQIWEAVTADGFANPLLTRFLHNKLLFYGNNLLRCYLSYLSPDFVAATFTIVGLALFMVGLYQINRQQKRWLLMLVLIAPIPSLFGIPKFKLIQAIILYSSQTLVILYGLSQLIKLINVKLHSPPVVVKFKKQ